MITHNEITGRDTATKRGRIRRPMTADEVIRHAFHHHYHSDHANAAIHTSPVRFSPLTFRLAELLEVTCVHLNEVRADAGRYPEDAGRIADDHS